MLMTSLPAHPPSLFSANQTPISKIRLEKHLTLLDERDAKDLSLIEELLFWSQVNEATDQFIIYKSKEVLNKVQDEFLRGVILWRLELRTLLSALRMHHAGIKQPKKNTFNGVGRWLGDIERNWDKNDFGLGHRVSWILPAQQMLSQHRTYELEKLLLGVVWQYYANECNQHYFDFPAVVIYVLRWDVIYRWTLYRADEAVRRFDKLVDDGLQDFKLSI